MGEWFLEEFGPYGFTLTQTLYSPDTFTPCKQVIHPKGFKTSINLTEESASGSFLGGNDLNGWSVSSKEWVIEECKILIREHLLNTYPEVFERKDFLPKQNLDQFKF